MGEVCQSDSLNEEVAHSQSLHNFVASFALATSAAGCHNSLLERPCWLSVCGSHQLADGPMV